MHRYVIASRWCDLSHRHDATIRLTEKLEPYQFQWFIHTARVTPKCDRSIKIYKVEVLRASDDAAMHAFLDAMKRLDRVFTLHAIKPLFPHCQIYICVVKLETCRMRAITVAMDLARVVRCQCEYIIKIYSVLIFPLVALLHRSLNRSLCERTFIVVSVTRIVA